MREVAYDLQRRVKQELAFPAVIHFYSWLLQGKLCDFATDNLRNYDKTFFFIEKRFGCWPIPCALFTSDVNAFQGCFMTTHLLLLIVR